MTAVIILFLICKIPGSIFRGLSCSLGADNESQKLCYHRQTIRTVRDIMMSRATCDPIHLLYFVTPALDLIQVIGRNPS